MSNSTRDVFQLSAKRRKLLEALLLEEGIDSSAKPSIEPRGDNGPAPLSFAQQRLWFLDQLEPNTSTYTIPLSTRLVGRLDVEALRSSLSEIVRRHEVLRTTFRIIDGQPMQVPAPSIPLS